MSVESIGRTAKPQEVRKEVGIDPEILKIATVFAKYLMGDEEIEESDPEGINYSELLIISCANEINEMRKEKLTARL